MPDELSDEELDGLNPEDHDNPDLIKRLRATATKGSRDAKAKDTELEAARREIALRRAGIDPDKGAGKAFAATLTGPVDDTATLAADYLEFRKELGLSEEPAAPAEGSEGGTAGEENGTPQSQDNGTAARQAAAAEGQPADNVNPDVARQLLDQAQTARDRGARWEEAAGGLVNARVNAFARGELAALERDGRVPSPS